ncbi:GNAT family N-acetyltransferase [soil metagenome]
MPEILIKKVDNEADKMKFIKFPWKIYKNDPNWVPPLIFDIKSTLNQQKNPFYKHAKMELYIAYKDGEIAGTIAAIVNKSHNDYYKDKVGFFGFYECINDRIVSDALYNKAKAFLKENGMDTMRGPVNPSTNDTCGFLTDVFDQPPVILMTYNPRYYLDLAEGYGFYKAKDLLAFMIDKDVINDEKMMAKLQRVSDMVVKKEGLTIRKVNLSDFKAEVEKVRQVYNNAWQDNWGFVPMTKEEFEYIAGTLKQAVDKDFVMFAEKDGKVIGFNLALPDLNQATKVLDGKLLTFKLLKFLQLKKKIDLLRVIIMGVNVEYHKKGIDAVFYLEIIKEGNRKGYRGAEISWVLEDNLPMVQTATKLGAKVYKTYRIYDVGI